MFKSGCFLVRKYLITTPIYLKYPWKMGLIVLRLVFTCLISRRYNACLTGLTCIWLVAEQQFSQPRYCAWVISIEVFALLDSWLSLSWTNIEGGFPHSFTWLFAALCPSLTNFAPTCYLFCECTMQKSAGKFLPTCLQANYLFQALGNMPWVLDAFK